jgi:multidrug efflux pump subunit AcrA (membrane-fusion protein)
MSAQPQPAPAPTVEKPQLVAALPRKRSLAGLWIALAIALLAVGAYRFYRSRAKSSQAAATVTIRTVKVTSGATAPALRVTGSTSARIYASINAPVMMGPDSGRGLLLQTLAKSGSMVKAGEVIAQLDTQAIDDHADDVLALVQQADDAIKRRRADQSIELENWRQSILSAKAVWDKAKLDYAARAVRTDIDQEILKLNMDEAEATYNNAVTGLAITRKKFLSQLTLLQSLKEEQVRHHNRHAHQRPVGAQHHLPRRRLWPGAGRRPIESGTAVCQGGGHPYHGSRLDCEPVREPDCANRSDSAGSPRCLSAA